MSVCMCVCLPPPFSLSPSLSLFFSLSQYGCASGGKAVRIDPMFDLSKYSKLLLMQAMYFMELNYINVCER